MTGGSSSVDQTRNAIQNILLQELENFEGIMIATTNLTDNLDKAFDRRFLFKINVGMPDAESRFNIWKVKLPKVKKPILNQLSTLYSLSGGQIDNVVRKVILNELVGEKADSIESLSLLCRQELSLAQNNQRTSIGFTNHKQAV
jgi:SpoVK/Ycf46/Vps4 family AAA+-type ATPase